MSGRGLSIAVPSRVTSTHDREVATLKRRPKKLNTGERIHQACACGNVIFLLSVTTNHQNVRRQASLTDKRRKSLRASSSNG
jgi:hypothetical protein